MGAEVFLDVGTGKFAHQAFRQLVAKRLFEHGHSGYTGSIAEKEGYIELGECDDLKAAMEEARRLIKAEDERIDDKWGPAGCLKVKGKDQYVFFGWASS